MIAGSSGATSRAGLRLVVALSYEIGSVTIAEGRMVAVALAQAIALVAPGQSRARQARHAISISRLGANLFGFSYCNVGLLLEHRSRG